MTNKIRLNQDCWAEVLSFTNTRRRISLTVLSKEFKKTFKKIIYRTIRRLSRKKYHRSYASLCVNCIRRYIVRLKNNHRRRSPTFKKRKDGDVG